MSRSDNGIRALERGLALLEELNLHDSARPTTLSRALGLPRSSVYRILETLEEQGYVERSVSNSQFRVTDRVRLLARGVTSRTRLAAVAGPIIHRMATEMTWPVDVAAHEAGAMYVQETTNPLSPMAMARSMIGKPLPMLRTAAGRAVLAFSTDAERDAILALVRARNDPANLPYLDPASLERILADTKERGYSTRSGETAIPDSYSDRTSSIGVPIMNGTSVIGSIVVIWITPAMPISEGVDRFLGLLTSAAQDIGAAL
ncbi:helix-turn-helix domain-containing protein [Pseudooceanicola sp. MF1-13]|uniref:helix-turn-helix domain-containing protein n=1 Tax=Pseudooceanicola sp. MF1-13 TaxID=3379095 RepID=UPI0038912693